VPVKRLNRAMRNGDPMLDPYLQVL
jgi:hypothetical protein